MTPKTVPKPNKSLKTRSKTRTKFSISFKDFRTHFESPKTLGLEALKSRSLRTRIGLTPRSNTRVLAHEVQNPCCVVPEYNLGPLFFAHVHEIQRLPSKSKPCCQSTTPAIKNELLGPCFSHVPDISCLPAKTSLMLPKYNACHPK